MTVLPIHWRMAELWIKKTNQGLTNKEFDDMAMCLEANKNYALKLSGLYSLSGIASQVDDTDWLHAICAEIDKLEIAYKIGKTPS